MQASSEIQDFVKTLNGKPILVYGLGKSGTSSALALKKAGANVIVGDDDTSNVEKMRDQGFAVLDIDHDEFDVFAFLLLAPGVPLTHPAPHKVVQRAIDADIEILCDIELFFRIYPENRTIGVTGTNGKSTTGSLIHHILGSVNGNAVLAGNIGTPVFDIEIKNSETWVVVEISSFQIDLCPTFRPDVSVLLNISPDHIDRHGSMDEYCAVKERLTHVQNTEKMNIAVIGTDDEYTADIHKRTVDLALRSITEISVSKPLENGVFIEGDTLIVKRNGEEHRFPDLDRIPSLKGKHNYQNTCAAFAALMTCGLNVDDIWSAVQTFPGLHHRQFLVRTINGVTYVNDSKATNAASAAVALGCRNNVYWIVGGRKKKNGLDGLEEFFSRIKHAFLIGESTEDFADWFDKYGMEYTRCFDLQNAVSSAHDMAQENRGQPGGAGVVLLSPACASFDQFSSFEHRGDAFAQYVEGLSE